MTRNTPILYNFVGIPNFWMVVMASEVPKDLMTVT